MAEIGTKRYAHMLDTLANAKEYLPAQFNNIVIQKGKNKGQLVCDGTVENVTQIYGEIAGRKILIPQKGKPGAHIFLTQKKIKHGRKTKDPAFQTIKANMVSDTETVKELDGTVSKRMEIGGVVTRYGRMRSLNKRSAWDAMFGKSAKNAARYLRDGSAFICESNTQSADSQNTGIVQSAAGNAKVLTGGGTVKKQ